jgi:hypothetical protein
MNELIDTGAVFSECRKYRYTLWRIWDKEKPFLQVIGLNPSTADENKNDPTITRVIGFAKDWGYGGVYMTNLFSIRSTDPSILKEDIDLVMDNDKNILDVKSLCKDVLFAWGGFKPNKRSIAVSNLFETAICLGLNNDGSPKHPLYISKKTKPVKFK